MNQRNVPPFVSIVIPNYNGAHYLPMCLEAIRDLQYPSDRFEVIVSDNGSVDGSIELLRDKYPWVRVIENGQNLGFASGCNVGIRASRGDYIVLLNNDAAPEPIWLENLVAVAEANPQAGIVTGRIRLFYDQLVLRILANPVYQLSDGRVVSVRVFGVETGIPGGVVQYLEGFYGWERASAEGMFRWMGGKALLGIPVPPGDGDWTLILRLAVLAGQSTPVRLVISLHEQYLAEWMLSEEFPATYELRIPALARAWAVPLLQNAGSIVFWDGSGRDRGTFVRDCELFYEEDRGQYSVVEEVAAGCGASLLLRRTMLEDVGLLDDDFFLYYEDTDLSLRARWLGWKVLYAPEAIVRHIHCGSSQEWSPLFIYYTDRNRLAMLFKNGLPSQVLRAWISYGTGAVVHLLRVVVAWLKGKENWHENARYALIRWRVIKSLLCWLPKLWRERRRIHRGARVASAEMIRWFGGENACRYL